MAQFWRCDRCGKETEKTNLNLTSTKLNDLEGRDEVYHRSFKEKIYLLSKEKHICSGCTNILIELLTGYWKSTVD